MSRPWLVVAAALWSAGLWVVLTGAALSVDHVQRRIASLEHQLEEVRSQERALVVRQEELSRVIKDLKTTARHQTWSFAVLRIEMALQELRALLTDRDALDRRAAALEHDLDEARTRLRSAIRDEIVGALDESHIPGDEPGQQLQIRALLEAYPAAPVLPALPPAPAWPATSAEMDPAAVAELATLIRNARERQDFALRRLEVAHTLLLEEKALYELVGDPNAIPPSRAFEVQRRIEEVVGQMELCRQEMRTLDDALLRLQAGPVDGHRGAALLP